MIDDEEIEKIAASVMRLSGMDTSRGSYILIEDNGDGELFMKFMSDKAVTDNFNGNVLFAYLKNDKCDFEFFDGRKFFVQADDLRSMLRKKGVYDDKETDLR